MSEDRDLLIAELALGSLAGSEPGSTASTATARLGPGVASLDDPTDGEATIAQIADLVAAELATLASRGAPTPPIALRDRVLSIASPASAFQGFVERTAELLDWPFARAKTLLDSQTDPEGDRWIDGPAPGIRLLPLQTGDRHGEATCALLWCAPGARFPDHRHHGSEWALVLAGCAVNSDGSIWSVGDLVHQPANSVHSFTTPEDSVPLLAVVVVRKGLELV